MKYTSVILAVTLVSGSVMFAGTAQANDQLAASLCDYVAADDKNRLRKKLKESRVKLRNVFDGINCGGNNLLRHAMASNANDAGTFIVKKLSKSTLSNGADYQWAQDNGHGGSPIAAAVKERGGL